MRIDRFLSQAGLASRKEIAKAAKSGHVCVNGVCVKDCSAHIDPNVDCVTFYGEKVKNDPFVYVLLNKPEGYVSATEDTRFPPVTDLLDPVLQKRGLFPCGRLDKDTVGLMLLTDDGALAHLLLSPKRHVPKTYRFACAEPLCKEAEKAFLEGMTLGNGDELKEAHLCCDEGRMAGTVSIVEGKYHQIKRMFGALDNRITELERISFGPLSLDASLKRGEYRPLTEAEIAALRDAVK